VFFGPKNETVILHRDVDVVAVPSGEAGELEMGTLASITQSLGGAFTVMVRGNLYRIAGHDADALDKPMPPEPDVPDNPTDAQLDDALNFVLRQCYDPEIPVNIVDLGLIYRAEIEESFGAFRRVEIDMTLTAPACGMGPILVHDVRTKLLRVPTINEVEINLVFDPPWSREMMSEAAQLETGMF
jgi:probable FeS assembly SUF system protein SufT